MRKLLLILILLSLPACAGLPPLAELAVGVTAGHRASKIGDDLRSTDELRQDANTMTETAYQKCLKGDSGACNEQKLYTYSLFLLDNALAPLFGCSEHMFTTHGQIWHCIDEKLPQISKICENYGGYKYDGNCHK